MAINSRTNYGSFNEHYINATTIYIEKLLNGLIDDNKLDDALALLKDYYQTVSPQMYDALLQFYPTEKEQKEHLLEVVKEDKMLRIWMPHDSSTVGAVGIKALMDKYPLPTSPVTYIDDYGNTVKTIRNVLVGSMYMVILEKIGDDWGASSIPKRQHHGIPGKLTDADKASLPWREQGFKTLGESEFRLLLGTLDPVFAASLIQFANSPAMCVEAAENILLADKPTAIEMAIDYRKYASKPGRSVQYLRHMLEGSGIEIVRGELS